MFVNLNGNSAHKPRFLGEARKPVTGRDRSERIQIPPGRGDLWRAEPAEYVYQVIDGAARSYKLLSDGRRQIGAFHLIGDIFGLENGGVHRFTAEAIVDTTVRLVKRVSLAHVAESDVSVAHDLLNMTAINLNTPKIICCCWDARPHSNAWPRSCWKWTSD